MITIPGINLCFANVLLERGCNVLFADLTLRAEAQQSLKTYDGNNTKFGKAAFCKTDVAEWKQLENMFVKAEESFGGSGADIVVPGAGVYEPVCLKCNLFSS